MFIHETVPPGVPVMKSKRAAITYVFSNQAHAVNEFASEPQTPKSSTQFFNFWFFRSTITEPEIHMRLLLRRKRATWESGVIEQSHESIIHVKLLVAVKKREPGIAGDEIDLRFLVSPNHHHIL